MTAMRQPLSDTQVGRSNSWMTTFNDMMTLLMVFFVLLFSMGRMDVKRFENFQNALQSAMGVLEAGRHAPDGVPADRQGYAADPQAGKTERLAEKENFQILADQQGLEARYTPQGIQLTLDEALLFPSARAQLTGEGLAMLEQISRAIKPLNRHIRVVGHTDDRPIRSRRFASNWELSAARAVSVVAFFIQQGGIAPTRLSAAGYGASRPRAPNDTPGNRARNRRVEIILGQPLVMDVNVKHNEGHEPVRVR